MNFFKRFFMSDKIQPVLVDPIFAIVNDDEFDNFTNFLTDKEFSKFENFMTEKDLLWAGEWSPHYAACSASIIEF